MSTIALGDPALAARRLAVRAGLAPLAVVIGAFFALPMLWLVVAPFDRTPTLAVEVPEPTLANVAAVFENPFALRSLLNSAALGVATAALVVVCGALAAYALARAPVPGRDALLTLLLLFSSVVSGTAAMVPVFQLVFRLGLINTRTGVVLVLAGGLLPTAIFILTDFVEGLPSSYEESAQVFGASAAQTLRDVVGPLIRPGLAVIGAWSLVNVWGEFLIPFILLRDPRLSPAAVVMFTFYTEAGMPDMRLVAAFALLFTLPVVTLYLIVRARYGFRFHGGIKG